MPKTNNLQVEQLRLDLKNFRTVPQADENHALHVLVSMDPKYFWGITDSLLQSGYLAAENIIVLKSKASDKRPVVKEGNRRVGSLKLILGLLTLKDLQIPDSIQSKISQVDNLWKQTNSEVPCLVYEPNEEEAADKLVDRIHGYEESAGRLRWNAVARARHNREKNGANEPVLDLLEKYLKNGKNLTVQDADLWGGAYPLTVLEEAMLKVYSRLGFESMQALVDAYPIIKNHRNPLENMLHDIGMEILTFPIIRSKDSDFALARYGIPFVPSNQNTTNIAISTTTQPSAPITTAINPNPTAPPGGAPSTNKKTYAVSSHDERSVLRKLRSFTPKGQHREKLATLVEEAKKLKLKYHKYAFCFVLRSMFELSAKAYCKDHPSSGIKVIQNNRYRPLKDVLDEVSKYLTQNGKDKEMNNLLHGAMVELAKPKGIMSVESLNQLIHNPDFTISGAIIRHPFGVSIRARQSLAPPYAYGSLVQLFQNSLQKV